ALRQRRKQRQLQTLWRRLYRNGLWGKGRSAADRGRSDRPAHRYADGTLLADLLGAQPPAAIADLRPPTRGRDMSDDIAIIGIGIHRFGRSEGVSGLAQGAHAAREALRDAGVPWNRVGIAFGGSVGAGNADALTTQLGLTGLPFINVANGCAT